MKTPEHNSTDNTPAAVDPYEAAEEARQALSGMIFAALKMRGRTFRAAPASLPLTVIAGFLGAGKTTLLNHLLVEPHGRRLAVLVNDFGRINIDADLVSSRTDDMISLTNGCACCAVAGDLTETLIKIAEREELPDAIVLEASGIADTQAIVQIALTNPAIRVDGALVVIDAETVFELGEDQRAGRLFRNQIAAADLIALSKLDLLDEAGHTASRDWLADHAPGKPVVEALNGAVPAEVVLGIGATHKASSSPPVSMDHINEFGSFSFTIDEPLDGERLQALFDSLPKSLLRAKGVLNLAEEPARRTVYQRVGQRRSSTPAEPWGDETPRTSIVFIGPAGWLDRSKLEAGLEACRADRDEVIPAKTLQHKQR